MGEGRNIFLIYARAENGVIGANGALPWHLPADLKHFKALTLGKPMIMGRKTFESLPGLLPKRRHIVLSRDADFKPEGAEIAHSVDVALELAGGGEVAIIGGAAIYALFMPLAARIHLTQIHGHYEGDTFMQPLGSEWAETSREDHDAVGGSERTAPAYSFITYERRA